MKRKLVLTSGIISLISSIILITLYGLYLLVMGGYVFLVLSFVLPFAGATGNAAELISLLLTLLTVCAIPTAVGIVGMIFSTKLLKVSKMQDYYYKVQKGRLITYIIFFFLFSIAMIGYGVFIMQRGGLFAGTDNSSLIANILNSFPFGLVIGPTYLATAVLLLIDVIRNKNKIFKANIPTPPLTREQLATQQITQQPQIITLKPGEELPDYLKGRVIPIPPQKIQEDSSPEPINVDISKKKEGSDKSPK